MQIPSEYVRNLYRLLVVFLAVISLFFAVKLLSELRAYGMMGSSGSNVVAFSGHGEVTAVPDIATVNFTIRKEAKTVKEAQKGVADKEKQALDFLKGKNIEEKDIKTENASFYPKYEYVRGVCPEIKAGGISYDCGGGKQVLTGYEASESITVKVRNTDDAGAIIQGLGTVGVSDLNGPNFTVENEESLKAEARKKAIEDAKNKAKVLAKDLDVRLVRISSFSESGNLGPMFYGKAMMAQDSVLGAGSAPANLPKGENTISSDVTITYEIR